jgi:hypothetical protein
MNKAARRFHIIFFLLVFTPLLTNAKPVTIQGKAADYSKERLVFSAYTNMISFTEEELGSCQVSDSGEFRCNIELEETRLVFTRLGMYNCFFFAEPGMNYEVRLPPRRDKSLNEEANPYFEEISVHLSVSLLGTDEGTTPPGPVEELNFLIRAFNDSFYPYYYKYVVSAYTDDIDRKEISTTIEKLAEPFDSISNAYFNVYKRFRLGLLNHYGAQQSNRRIMEDYFLDSDVKYFNPAYMELFNIIFEDYFGQFTGDHPNRKLPLLLNREKDYTAIMRLLERDGELVNDTLRELVMVKGLYEGFYDEANIRSSMLQLLDSVQINTSIGYTGEIVSDVMVQLTRLLPGFKPSDFALLDSDSNLVHLSDFRGSYVYLNFCNSFSYYCIKEYEYLKILHQRMTGQNLSMVTILVDDSYAMMKDLTRNNNYPWTFLHFSNQPEVLANFDIQSYPAYYLLGPDGEMLLSPAPSPLENFENTFYRIIQTR